MHAARRVMVWVQVGGCWLLGVRASRRAASCRSFTRRHPTPTAPLVNTVTMGLGVVQSGLHGSAVSIRIRVYSKGVFQSDRIIRVAQGDACALPFGDEEFDAATMGYGLRNVPDRPAALSELHRVLRPGASAAVLDFNNSNDPAVDGAQVGGLAGPVCIQSGPCCLTRVRERGEHRRGGSSSKPLLRAVCYCVQAGVHAGVFPFLEVPRGAYRARRAVQINHTSPTTIRFRTHRSTTTPTTQAPGGLYKSTHTTLPCAQAWFLETLVVPAARAYDVAEEYEYLRPSIKAFPTGEEQVDCIQWFR
jgi:ubiquinone/menaquinone biosynthesis C-methylase UbiE